MQATDDEYGDGAPGAQPFAQRVGQAVHRAVQQAEEGDLLALGIGQRRRGKAPLGGVQFDGARDLGEQFFRDDGLFDEAHRAQLHRRAIIVDLGIGADEYELRFRQLLDQRARHVQTVHLRHAHVADDDLRPLPFRQRQSFASGRSEKDVEGAEAGAPQDLRDALAHPRFVVDDQKFRHGAVPLSSVSFTVIITHGC